MAWLDSFQARDMGEEYRSHSDILPRRSFRGAGVRDGTPGVFYDDNGRIFYPGDNHTRTTSSLPRGEKFWKRQMRPDDTFTYDPRKTNSESRGPRSYEFSRGVGDTPRSSGRSIITKHYDGYKRSPNMDYRGAPRGEVIAVSGPPPVEYYRPREKYVREGSVIVEERIVSHARPWIWPLFLITGFLMFGAGVANALFCVDYHWYSLLWVPIFIIIFAIFGAVHKGIYRGRGGRWRNWGYIIIGILTTLAVFVGCALVQIRLNHVTIQITEHGTSDFMAYELDRMRIFSEYPRVNLTTALDTNVWACYSIDWVALILIIIGFVVLTSVIVVGNNYYNSNHEYRREVEPFCRPSLFNPYGQISIGQAMVFIGIVLKTAVHGNYRIRWQDYWVPVWCGIFPMVAGAVSAIALKRIGLKNGRTLAIVAIVLEMISLLAMAAILGINSFSLYENILSLQPGPISTTVYSVSLLTASVVIFVIMDIALLVSFIYSLALTIRLIVEACRKDEKQREKRYYAEERYYAERYPEKIERDERDGRGEFVDAIPMYRDDGERF